MREPLLTVLRSSRRYGGVPKETFAPILGSQDVPNRFYYHLKKDFFPRVYWSSFVKVRGALLHPRPLKSR